jgi:hypothetical protein
MSSTTRRALLTVVSLLLAGPAGAEDAAKKITIKNESLRVSVDESGGFSVQALPSGRAFIIAAGRADGALAGWRRLIGGDRGAGAGAVEAARLAGPAGAGVAADTIGAEAAGALVIDRAALRQGFSGSAGAARGGGAVIGADAVAV